MKKIMLTIAAAVLFFGAAVVFVRDNQSLVTLAEALKKEGINGLELVFEDKFDFLDENVWTKVTATRNGGHWTENQVFTENGNLIIRTERLTDGELGDGYYSGAVNTSSSHEFKYGYFETRCKPTPVCGAWSAFWLLCGGIMDEADGGRNGAEIDVFEAAYYGYPSGMRDFFVACVHYDGYDSAHKGHSCVPYRVQNLHGAYHTFALLWTKDAYIFFVDGVQFWQLKNSNAISQVPEYIKFSSEVGGKNGVADNKNNKNTWSGDIHDNAEGVLPADFVIDYVRVYRFN